MCMGEQLVTNLPVWQYLRLQEKVQASESKSGRSSKARIKWLHRLRSRLYDVMGNDLKMLLVSWSVMGVL